jgi:hypothetical protein
MKFRGLLLVCVLVAPVVADEGMWLFNAFPSAQVAEKYKFEVAPAFLDHLRLSTVCIGAGSGSFVSASGLLLTNHHIVRDCIDRLSTPAHDYLKDGFYAASRDAELPCPGLEASLLVALEEVSSRVKDAAKVAATAADALARRNAAVAAIERECAAKTGNLCSVVKLFAGERYDLYQYRRYRDLRLVFAPEFATAFFGGDPDSFTYPRYALDAAFLRAWENGKPASTPQFLAWSRGGVKEDDLVFSVGNPGSTSRLAIGTQLSFFRDTRLPLVLSRLNTRITALRTFTAQSEANRRAAEGVLLGLTNSWKSTAAQLIGLRDDRMMARKNNLDRRLRRAVETDPKLGEEAGKVWDDVASAYKTWTPSEKAYQALERPQALSGTLFGFARILVRSCQERAKPDAQRLSEYRDSARAALEAALYTSTPVDDGVEAVLLAQYLDELKTLGEKDAPLKSMVQGATSQQAAEAIVRVTRLKDLAERRRLAADPAAVAHSADPMIKLAEALDAPARKLRKKYEDTIESLDAGALETIAHYRFKLQGAADYPDATSSARVTFGAAKTYRDKTQAPVPFATTFGGLYHRTAKEEPYVLPQRWTEAKSQLDLVVPFDFVSTCDAAGGASGGPAVNQEGELVGILFDTNLEGVTLTYAYSEEQARAVHVASQGIIEALRKIYKAEPLLRELGIAR